MSKSIYIYARPRVQTQNNCKLSTFDEARDYCYTFLVQTRITRVQSSWQYTFRLQGNAVILATIPSEYRGMHSGRVLTVQQLHSARSIRVRKYVKCVSEKHGPAPANGGLSSLSTGTRYREQATPLLSLSGMGPCVDAKKL